MNLVEESSTVEMFPKETIKEEKNIYKLLASFSCSPKSPRDSLPHYCVADCGVADGVGGWRDLGVDPSIFAWELMNNSKRIYLLEPSLSPKKCMELAYDSVIKDEKVYAGSSTACIINIDKETGLCKICNLGDSGLIVIRDGKVVYKTKEGTFYFNAPHQLSVIPPQYQNGLNLTNTVEDSIKDEFQLLFHDILILATDGLFDNVFEDDIIDKIKQYNLDKKNEDAQAIETSLCSLTTDIMALAMENSLSYTVDTPFSEAADAAGHHHTGGKVDDITFIAGYVHPNKEIKLVSHM